MKLAIFFVFASLWALASSQCINSTFSCSGNGVCGTLSRNSNLCICQSGWLGSSCNVRMNFSQCFVYSSGQPNLCLQWATNDTDLWLSASSPTMGWFGLTTGFDTGCSMCNGDVWLGSVQDLNGAVTLVDRMADQYALPPSDAQQDLFEIAGFQNSTHTTWSFRRKLRTGDTRDRNIVQGPMQFAFASRSDDSLIQHNLFTIGFTVTLIPLPVVPTLPPPPVSCPNNCSSRGVCTASNTCQCPVGYLGDDCSIAAPYKACFKDDWVCLYWIIAGDSIWAQLRGRTQGWVGLIIGSDDNGMRNGDAWWGFVSDAGAPAMIDAWASSYDTPSRDSRQDFYNVTGFQTSTYTVLNFRRLLDTKDPQDRVINMDWMKAAMATGDSDTFTKHSSEQKIAINFKTGESKVANPDALVVAHGVLMLMAWAVFGQIGPFLAFLISKKSGIPTAYFPKNLDWFKWHRGLQVFAILLTIIGFIIINVRLGPATPDVVSPHGVSGYFFFAFMLVQALIAFLFHSDNSHKVHQWLGRALLLLMFVFQLPSGMFKLWEWRGIVGFIIVIAFWVLTYIITAIVHRNAQPSGVEMVDNK